MRNLCRISIERLGRQFALTETLFSVRFVHLSFIFALAHTEAHLIRWDWNMWRKSKAPVALRDVRLDR